MSVIHSESNGVTERLVRLGVGIAPILAVSHSLYAGLGFSLLLLVVTFATRSLSYALRGVIPAVQRSAYVLVFAAGFTGLIQVGLELFLPGLAFALGVFVPLLAVHAFVVENHSVFQSDKSFAAAHAAISREIFPLIGLILAFSLFRELVGSGRITLFQDLMGAARLTIPGFVDNPLAIAGYTSAAFIALGIVLAYLPKPKGKED